MALGEISLLSLRRTSTACSLARCHIIVPRLEDDIGWLFQALLGTSSSTAHPSDTGVFVHEFTFASDEADIPWVTLAKWLPANVSGEDIGLRITDGRAAAMRLMLPGRGRVRMRLDFLGIKPEFIVDPATNASWATSFEEEDSVPITSKPAGGFEMPVGASIYPAGCTIDFTNGLTDPVRQEAVIGSYYPDDLAVLGRGAIVRFPLKVSIYDHWSQVIFNIADASTATDWKQWSPVTYSSDWCVVCESPGVIPGQTSSYRLKVYGKKMEWVVDPVRMVGNQMMLLNFTGTLSKPASGTAFYIELWNKTANYTWPS